MTKIYILFYICQGDYPIIEQAFLSEGKAKEVCNSKNEHDRWGDGRYYHVDCCSLDEID